MVQWQNGNADPLWEGVTVATTVESLQPPSKNWRGKVQKWRDGLRFGGNGRLARWQTWLATHPTEAKRRACLEQPYQVYGDDRSIALTAGVAVVLLNLNLLSLFYSATVRGPNSVPAFAIGFAVISLSLLPFVCQFTGPLRALFGKIAKIVAGFTLIKIVPQALGAALFLYATLGDMEIFQRALESFVRGELPEGFAASWRDFVITYFVVNPALLFGIFMPLFLIAYLVLDVWLKRKILLWFGWNFLVRHSVFVFAYSTIVLTLVLIFVILPIADWIIIPTAHDPLAPLVLVPMIAALLFALANALLFVFLDRRYTRHCPYCETINAQLYAVGMCCIQCKKNLHAWLVLV